MVAPHFFLVILILGPLISTIVFYGITGKNSGFDFFALILTTFSLFLGLIVFWFYLLTESPLREELSNSAGKKIGKPKNSWTIS